MNSADKAVSAKLAWSEYGRGNPHTLLLLHGFGESQFTWRYIRNALARDYHVITLDLKGFGESEKPRDGQYSIYDHALAVRQFIRQHQLRDLTLVGHSLGGGIALALTLDSQEKDPQLIKQLVLINSVAYRQNLPSMLRKLNTPLLGNVGFRLMPAARFARKAYEFGFYDDSKIPEEGVRETARMMQLAGARYAWRQTSLQMIPEDIDEISERYQEIRQPVLILWGHRDVVLSRDNATRLHRALPDSRLAFIRHAGHVPQEEKPQRVAKIMMEFLGASAKKR